MVRLLPSWAAREAGTPIGDMGIVESVGADGSIKTIEGNSSDMLARRTYGLDGGGAVGYVRLG